MNAGVSVADGIPLTNQSNSDSNITYRVNSGWSTWRYLEKP